jgi:hypothetical protein
MLSPYSHALKKELSLQGKPVKKLTPNLLNKCKYVVHYQNLKTYLRLGMKLLTIHRGIQFTQSPWLKPYISLNTNMRKSAKNTFEKDFYKLMNNSVFGKTMENLRKRTNVELVHTPKRMLKVAAKPSFDMFKIFNEDLVAVHLKKGQLTLNRPTYVGFCILDISKILMYSFHYDYIKPTYQEHAKLLFTDTDSFCYQINTDDLYRDWQHHQHLFDFSQYPKEHHLYNITNKNVLGKMKDETVGVPISEFVGLRSKMYSILYGGTEKKTAKGISKTAIKKQLRHAAYRDCLLNRNMTMVHMKQIRSFSHQLYSLTVNKIGLSPYDDKRYVLHDGCDTLAHGHFKITQSNY